MLLESKVSIWAMAAKTRITPLLASLAAMAFNGSALATQQIGPWTITSSDSGYVAEARVENRHSHPVVRRGAAPTELRSVRMLCTSRGALSLQFVFSGPIPPSLEVDGSGDSDRFSPFRLTADGWLHVRDRDRILKDIVSAYKESEQQGTKSDLPYRLGFVHESETVQFDFRSVTRVERIVKGSCKKQAATVVNATGRSPAVADLLFGNADQIKKGLREISPRNADCDRRGDGFACVLSDGKNRFSSASNGKQASMEILIHRGHSNARIFVSGLMNRIAVFGVPAKAIAECTRSKGYGNAGWMRKYGKYRISCRPWGADVIGMYTITLVIVRDTSF